MKRNTLKNVVAASSVMLAGLFVLTGCKDPGYMSPERKQSQERPEYDCRKSRDKICKVPWKDKIVLYCYKGAFPKVVRYKEEC